MTVEECRDTKEKRYKIYCGECKHILNRYGTLSNLISNPSLKIITSNRISNTIGTINEPYSVKCCRCIVKDLGCLRCGNIIGYNIVQPCNGCLRARNNGHLWLFHIQCVLFVENKDPQDKCEGFDLLNVCYLEAER